MSVGKTAKNKSDRLNIKTGKLGNLETEIYSVRLSDSNVITQHGSSTEFKNPPKTFWRV